MQTGREELLPGTSFTDHETRPVDGGEARDLFLDLQEGRVFTKDGMVDQPSFNDIEFRSYITFSKSKFANFGITSSDVTIDQPLTSWHAIRT